MVFAINLVLSIVGLLMGHYHVHAVCFLLPLHLWNKRLVIQYMLVSVYLLIVYL